MLNSLDLLVYAAIGFAAIAIVGIALQFIGKNPKVQKAGSIFSAILASVLAFCNLESTPIEYGLDIAAGFIFAAAAIAAVALSFAKNDKKAKIARIASIIAVLGGLFCTFII